MKNKGYTIMEAVVAMFLVLVMVGAVFSALMSGRRAITATSEKEEVFYSLQSTYAMLKDCRGNSNCYLNSSLNCPQVFFNEGTYELKGCNELFTFNFQSLCKAVNDENNKFEYKIENSSDNNNPLVQLFRPSDGEVEELYLPDFYVLTMNAHCKEGA